MIRNPVHHTSTLGRGHTLTVEWEPAAEWHSQWVVARNVANRRTVLGRCASFTEARARVSRLAVEHRAALWEVGA